jgi:hypothetical protein
MYFSLIDISFIRFRFIVNDGAAYIYAVQRMRRHACILLTYRKCNITWPPLTFREIVVYYCKLRAEISKHRLTIHFCDFPYKFSKIDCNQRILNYLQRARLSHGRMIWLLARPNPVSKLDQRHTTEKMSCCWGRGGRGYPMPMGKESNQTTARKPGHL